MSPVRLLFLSALFLGVAYLGTPFLLASYNALNVGRSTGMDVSNMKVTNGVSYILDSGKWLSFPLFSNGKAIKVKTNANISAGLPVEKDDEWNYALEVQLLDKEGNLLMKGERHLITKLTKLADPVTGETLTYSFYLPQDIVPCNSRGFKLKLTGKATNASHVRFRLLSRSPEIEEVGIRVFLEEKATEYKQAYQWNRLNNKQKIRMARGNVYPHEFLTEEERNNLIAYRWRSLGPSGVLDTDYSQRTIYFYEELEAEEESDPVYPAGLFVKKGNVGVIPVPPPGGLLQLEILHVGERLEHSGEVSSVTWEGKGLANRKNLLVVAGTEAETVEAFLEEGFVEVAPQRDVVVRAFLVQEGTRTEIAPAFSRMRGYLLTEDQPVEYRLYPEKGAKTHFKLAFRTIYSEGEVPQPKGITLRYEQIDRNGKVIKNGSITEESLPSLYDTLSASGENAAVSDAVVRYLTVPDTIVKLRFRSDFDLFLYAYTRPDDLKRSMRIPEDYSSLESEGKLPAWFPVKPEGEKDLYVSGKTGMLFSQRRPSEDNEFLLMGEYQRESFLPKGSWTSRKVLLPQKASPLNLGKFSSSTFQEIPRNKSTRVDLPGLPGQKGVKPNLLYLRGISAPEEITVILDGKPFYQGHLTGKRGNIQLPPMSVGRHSLKIGSTKKGRYYLSNQRVQGDHYGKKSVLRLNPRGLDFLYEKKSPEQEVLSVRVFTPFGTKARIKLNVSVKSPSTTKSKADILQTWTFSDRSFDIAFINDKHVPMLGTSQTLNEGQTFYLPLGDDLKPGTHKIRFRLEGAAEVYMMLYRIDAGYFERFTFFQENE